MPLSCTTTNVQCCSLLSLSVICHVSATLTLGCKITAITSMQRVQITQMCIDIENWQHISAVFVNFYCFSIGLAKHVTFTFIDVRAMAITIL